MKIDILCVNPYCDICKDIDDVIQTASNVLDKHPTIRHVSDPTDIKMWGLFDMPTILINERNVSSGYVPKLSQMRRLLMISSHNERLFRFIVPLRVLMMFLCISFFVSGCSSYSNPKTPDNKNKITNNSVWVPGQSIKVSDGKYQWVPGHYERILK